MSDQIQNDFGPTIRELRESQEPKLSLRALAKRCGISAAYLSNIERGLCAPPSVEVLKALARELNIDPSDLLIKANRVDVGLLVDTIDPGIVLLFRLIDSVMPTDGEPFLNLRNLLAFAICEFDGKDLDELDQLHLLATFTTAYAKLRLEKDNPSSELVEKLEHGNSVLRAIMPGLFVESNRDAVLREFLDLAQQRKWVNPPEGEQK